MESSTLPVNKTGRTGSFFSPHTSPRKKTGRHSHRPVKVKPNPHQSGESASEAGCPSYFASLEGCKVGLEPTKRQSVKLVKGSSGYSPSAKRRRTPLADSEAKPVTASKLTVQQDKSGPRAIGEASSDDEADSVKSLTDAPVKGHSKTSGKPRNLYDRAEQEAVPLGSGVFTAPSVTGGGLGLFAGKAFKKGEFITFYDGEREMVDAKRRSELLSQLKFWSHIARLDRYEIIHGLTTPVSGKGAGSFANHGFGGHLSPNAKYCVLEKGALKKLCLQALTDIEKGDEIFTDYGNDYWYRFQDAFPEMYERIFAAGLRDVVKGIDPDVLKNLDKIKPVDQFLKNSGVPIPDWPELKHRHTQWIGALSRYALFKIGAVEGDRLSLDALRLLKEDSHEYFIALAQFYLKKSFNKRVAQDWNYRGNSLAIPRNGVFNPAITRWSGFHFNIFAGLYQNGRFDIEEKALMHTISTLNPSHPMHEQLLNDYIFRFLEIDPDRPIVKDIKALNKKITALASKLRTSSAAPWPVVDGRKMPLSHEWSVKYLREFLFRKGVKLDDKRFYPDQLNDLMTDEALYNQAFLTFCRERGCDFRQTILVARKTGIRFAPVKGLKFDKRDCTLSALFLQYIHRAGFDSPETLDGTTNEMLCNSIDMITSDYEGTLSVESLLLDAAVFDI
ncbi:hypothetical protein GZ77_13800 [Endozoicomonas montiporae]|uniref:SET domain-containing protein n=2 Tax=Endozoicomonas montiporae TaxID=1027273 RepID=A0A081N4S0_9GAMM|nr:SET domain-containing protein [Endozoicomonas montiporae]AMO57687.1 SET domain protein [Endozoicomonas montiporae CL-33]KEQ13443.1 hypothetical protein GZ77_13800 [Endozoicomonas montiporae]